MSWKFDFSYSECLHLWPLQYRLTWLDRTRAVQAGGISQTPKKSLSGCAAKSILAWGYADKKVRLFRSRFSIMISN